LVEKNSKGENMPDELQKGQEVTWDLRSPYFRRAVRNGDESAHAALHDVVEEALSGLYDALGDAELYNDQIEPLYEHIMDNFITDEDQTKADDAEIAALEKEEAEDEAEEDEAEEEAEEAAAAKVQ
jgi:hypothetical protein